jgi:hypothetical protein
MGYLRSLLHLRPSPGAVIACVALVVACTGTATAASLITGAQIKNNSVTTKDVKNKSLRAGDFRPGTVFRGPAGARGAAGPQGAQGPQGLQGSQGLQGAPGLSDLEMASDSTPTNSASPKTLTVNCPADKQAISTGYDIVGGKTGVSPDTLLEVVADQVASFGNQGFAGAYETDPTTETWAISLSVLCARVGP